MYSYSYGSDSPSYTATVSFAKTVKSSVTSKNLTRLVDRSGTYYTGNIILNDSNHTTSAELSKSFDYLSIQESISIKNDTDKNDENVTQYVLCNQQGGPLYYGELYPGHHNVFADQCTTILHDLYEESFLEHLTH